jgi:leucyl-tRNA synthetase
VDPVKERAWMPVDLYVGGAEHAVLHLLYARFWHKVLYDRGHVSTAEPFRRLVNQGMILGEMEYTGYQSSSGAWAGAEQVTRNVDGLLVHKTTGESLREVSLEAAAVKKVGEGFVLAEQPEVRVESRAYKMSKSRGNVVNPDQIVHDYGADALRLYEMFMGPLEATKPWSMDGVRGVAKFLDRAWRMMVDDRQDSLAQHPAVQDLTLGEEPARVLHRTIKDVTRDLDNLQFNTAIARLMEFVNYFTRQQTRPREAMERFVLLLAPFAPHMAEELWLVLGHPRTLAYEPWPAYDEALTRESVIEVPVQVGKKVRAKIQVPADATDAQLEAAARADARIAALLQDQVIDKVIVVPGRLVNFKIK